MSLGLECKKIKRTGFLPAFMGGGLLAAMVPIVNMTVRHEMYVELDSSPIQILMGANWQLIAMLNVLLTIAGACMMYHIEYADNALQKMCTLPIREYNLFFGKAALLAAMSMVMLILEAAAIAFSSIHWFELTEAIESELLKSFGYAFVLMLPTVLSSLLVASLCKSMWMSLGIGIICVFLATMLPTDHFVLSLFPLCLPFQMYPGAAEDTICHFMVAGITEAGMIALAEGLLLKVRRCME